MASRLRRRVPLGRVDKGTNIWTYGPATQTHTATGILADEMMIGDDWSALRGVSTERATLRGIVGACRSLRRLRLGRPRLGSSAVSCSWSRTKVSLLASLPRCRTRTFCGHMLRTFSSALTIR
jgi:hypothetical protein